MKKVISVFPPFGAASQSGNQGGDRLGGEKSGSERKGVMQWTGSELTSGDLGSLVELKEEFQSIHCCCL